MSKYLFIAEKSSSMNAYKEVYKKYEQQISDHIGGSIDFISLRGHIFRNQEPKEYEEWNKSWKELYENDLPMVPKNWEIKPIDSAKEVIKKLQDALNTGNYDGLIVGTDADVEGYGIFYMVSQAIDLSGYKTLRFYETALTERDILASFRDMEDFYTTPRHHDAVQAYIFRSHWDWLIGMNFTTAYTVRYGQLMKIGSVKAPTLKLIYDNCNAIDHFEPKTSYGVKSLYSEGYEGNLIDDDESDMLFGTRKEAESILGSLSDKAKVVSYKKQIKTQKAPKLYALSDLQVDAGKIGYKPDQTLDIAQKLYEKKLLTYPRTSGNYLSSGKTGDFPGILNALRAIPQVAPYLSGITKDDIARASSDKNLVNDKEVAKSAHDALIPTGEKIDWDSLSKGEQDIYNLVARRFVAHFLPMFTEERMAMVVDNAGYLFKISGRRTIQNGFNEIFHKKSTDTIIPEHKKGDIIDVAESSVYERVSTPPKRYTMGSIISAMKNIASQVEDPELKKTMKESEGIGTEATRATILSDLQASGWIETKKNAIYITDAGRNYMENIRRETDTPSHYDYGIADPMKVAYWSAKDKEIQLGEKTVDEVMDEFLDYLYQVIHDVKSSGDPIKYHKPASSIGTCPLCGGKILSGKFGYYCSNYKAGCKFSIPNEIAHKKLSEVQKKNLAAGKTVHVSGMTNKSGKKFDAGLKVNTETGKVEFVFSNNKKS